MLLYSGRRPMIDFGILNMKYAQDFDF